MTLEEALEKVEMMKNKKSLETRNLFKKKFHKDNSEDLPSSSYRSKFAKKFSKEELVKDTIGGFVDTINLFLEKLANSKTNVDAYQLRNVQKKFQYLTGELDKKLTSLQFEY